MNKIVNNRGLTLVEVIMTLAILGVVICPLLNLLVLSGKISSQGKNEYKSIQTAQYYMEEIKSMDEIDRAKYNYNHDYICYERVVVDDTSNYEVEIRIIPSNYGMHYIEVEIISEGEVINSLEGSVVFE